MKYIQTAALCLMLFLCCTESSHEIGTPTPIHPINGEDTPLPVTFIWSSVDNSAGYRIHVDTNLTFSSAVILHDVGDTMYVSASLDTGTHYWQVAAYDEDNQLGDFSAPHNFNVIDTTTPNTGTIMGWLALQAGVSGDLNNTRVAIYTSYDDWLYDRVYMFTQASGSGNTATYVLADVAPGLYYLDAWKDVDNSGSWNTGDLFGVYGQSLWPSPQFTPFTVSSGQTFTANVTLIVLP